MIDREFFELSTAQPSLQQLLANMPRRGMSERSFSILSSHVEAHLHSIDTTVDETYLRFLDHVEEHNRTAGITGASRVATCTFDRFIEHYEAMLLAMIDSEPSASDRTKYGHKPPSAVLVQLTAGIRMPDTIQAAG